MPQNAQTQIKPKTQVEITDSTIFDSTSYANCNVLYLQYYRALPNEIMLRNINIKKAIDWVEENCNSRIEKIYRKQRDSDRKLKPRNFIYILDNNIFIDLDIDIEDCIIYILYQDNAGQEAMRIADALLKFKKILPKSQLVHTILQQNGKFYLQGIENKKPKFQISLNYNDDLQEIHKDLLKKLKQKNKAGLILLHGTPGTGKTTYIRYLMHLINKTIIFLSPKLAAHMDSPEMARILIENPNAVLVIEDAEELLKARESGNFFSISTILNLADGMLGESLGTQIICTFNTHKNNIDKALLRKGRLLASYEFKPLTVEKTNLLLENLGHKNYRSKTEMTLAEIYNIEENGFELNAVKKIGFGAVA